MIELITLAAATAGVRPRLCHRLGEKRARRASSSAAAEARAEEQAYAAADKLAIVATAKSTLTDTFTRPLRADALDASSRTFMQLATAQLGAFQEKARGDLAARARPWTRSCSRSENR